MKRSITIILIIISFLCIAGSFIFPVLFSPNDAVGIIGGADTPTYALLYFRNGFVWMTAAGLLIGGLAAILHRKG